MNLIKTENKTAGPPNTKSIAYYQFIWNISRMTGPIISPTPKQAKSKGGPIFCRFSDEISKNRIMDELKNPLWKKLLANRATLSI